VAFLKDRIQDIALHHPYYGYRRITAQLHRENIRVNHKWLLSLMRKLGIQGRIKYKYATTTNSKHNNPIYPNLIKEKIVTGINQIWCSDINYIRIFSGCAYLTAIIDIYFRIIVGYALGKTLKPKLTIAAL
jgi:putative transposase